jgi:hypothetical protein
VLKDIDDDRVPDVLVPFECDRRGRLSDECGHGLWLWRRVRPQLLLPKLVGISRVAIIEQLAFAIGQQPLVAWHECS